MDPRVRTAEDYCEEVKAEGEILDSLIMEKSNIHADTKLNLRMTSA